MPSLTALAFIVILFCTAVASSLAQLVDVRDDVASQLGVLQPRATAPRSTPMPSSCLSSSAEFCTNNTACSRELYEAVRHLSPLPPTWQSDKPLAEWGNGVTCVQDSKSQLFFVDIDLNAKTQKPYFADPNPRAADFIFEHYFDLKALASDFPLRHFSVKHLPAIDIDFMTVQLSLHSFVIDSTVVLTRGNTTQGAAGRSNVIKLDKMPTSPVCENLAIRRCNISSSIDVTGMFPNPVGRRFFWNVSVDFSGNDFESFDATGIPLSSPSAPSSLDLRDNPRLAFVIYNNDSFYEAARCIHVDTEPASYAPRLLGTNALRPPTTMQSEYFCRSVATGLQPYADEMQMFRVNATQTWHGIGIDFAVHLLVPPYTCGYSMSGASITIDEGFLRSSPSFGTAMPNCIDASTFVYARKISAFLDTIEFVHWNVSFEPNATHPAAPPTRTVTQVLPPLQFQKCLAHYTKDQGFYFSFVVSAHEFVDFIVDDFMTARAYYADPYDPARQHYVKCNYNWPFVNHFYYQLDHDTGEEFIPLYNVPLMLAAIKDCLPSKVTANWTYGNRHGNLSLVNSSAPFRGMRLAPTAGNLYLLQNSTHRAAYARFDQAPVMNRRYCHMRHDQSLMFELSVNRTNVTFSIVYAGGNYSGVSRSRSCVCPVVLTYKSPNPYGAPHQVVGWRPFGSESFAALRRCIIDECNYADARHWSHLGSGVYQPDPSTRGGPILFSNVSQTASDFVPPSSSDTNAMWLNESHCAESVKYNMALCGKVDFGRSEGYVGFEADSAKPFALYFKGNEAYRSVWHCGASKLITEVFNFVFNNSNIVKVPFDDSTPAPPMWINRSGFVTDFSGINESFAECLPTASATSYLEGPLASVRLQYTDRAEKTPWRWLGPLRTGIISFDDSFGNSIRLTSEACDLAAFAEIWEKHGGSAVDQICPVNKRGVQSSAGGAQQQQQQSVRETNDGFDLQYRTVLWRSSGGKSGGAWRPGSIASFVPFEFRRLYANNSARNSVATAHAACASECFLLARSCQMGSRAVLQTAMCFASHGISPHFVSLPSFYHGLTSEQNISASHYCIDDESLFSDHGGANASADVLRATLRFIHTLPNASSLLVRFVCHDDGTAHLITVPPTGSGLPSLDLFGDYERRKHFWTRATNHHLEMLCTPCQPLRGSGMIATSFIIAIIGSLFNVFVAFFFNRVLYPWLGASFAVLQHRFVSWLASGQSNERVSEFRRVQLESRKRRETERLIWRSWLTDEQLAEILDEFVERIERAADRVEAAERRKENNENENENQDENQNDDRVSNDGGEEEARVRPPHIAAPARASFLSCVRERLLRGVRFPSRQQSRSGIARFVRLYQICYDAVESRISRPNLSNAVVNVDDEAAPAGGGAAAGYGTMVADSENQSVSARLLDGLSSSSSDSSSSEEEQITRQNEEAAHARQQRRDAEFVSLYVAINEAVESIERDVSVRWLPYSPRRLFVQQGVLEPPVWLIWLQFAFVVGYSIVVMVESASVNDAFQIYVQFAFNIFNNTWGAALLCNCVFYVLFNEDSQFTPKVASRDASSARGAGLGTRSADDMSLLSEALIEIPTTSGVIRPGGSSPLLSAASLIQPFSAPRVVVALARNPHFVIPLLISVPALCTHVLPGFFVFLPVNLAIILPTVAIVYLLQRAPEVPFESETKPVLCSWAGVTAVVARLLSRALICFAVFVILQSSFNYAESTALLWGDRRWVESINIAWNSQSLACTFFSAQHGPMTIALQMLSSFFA